MSTILDSCLKVGKSWLIDWFSDRFMYSVFSPSYLPRWVLLALEWGSFRSKQATCTESVELREVLGILDKWPMKRACLLLKMEWRNLGLHKLLSRETPGSMPGHWHFSTHLHMSTEWAHNFLTWLCFIFGSFAKGRKTEAGNVEVDNQMAFIYFTVEFKWDLPLFC